MPSSAQAMEAVQAAQARAYVDMLEDGWSNQQALAEARAHPEVYHGMFLDWRGTHLLLRAQLQQSGFLVHRRWKSRQPLQAPQVHDLLVRLHEGFAPTSFLVYQWRSAHELDVLSSEDLRPVPPVPIYIEVSAPRLESELLHDAIAADGRFAEVPLSEADQEHVSFLPW